MKKKSEHGPSPTNLARGVVFDDAQKKAVAERMFTTALDTDRLLEDMRTICDSPAEAYEILEYLFFREAIIFGLTRRTHEGRSAVAAKKLNEKIHEDDDSGLCYVDDMIDKVWTRYSEQHDDLMNQADALYSADLAAAEAERQASKDSVRQQVKSLISKIAGDLGVPVTEVTAAEAEALKDDGEKIAEFSMPIPD